MNTGEIEFFVTTRIKNDEQLDDLICLALAALEIYPSLLENLHELRKSIKFASILIPRNGEALKYFSAEILSICDCGEPVQALERHLAHEKLQATIPHKAQETTKPLKI